MMFCQSKLIDILHKTPDQLPKTTLTVQKKINLYHFILQILELDIQGSVVELGSHIGITACFLQCALNTKRELHIYDSFSGLPEIDERDMPTCLKEGGLKADIKTLKDIFAEFKVPLPNIHVGWFHETIPLELPTKISFVHLDGDLYKSTLHGLMHIYPRMTRGAIGVLDDYNWKGTPGVKLACEDFFKDKKENISELLTLDDSCQAFFIKS